MHSSNRHRYLVALTPLAFAVAAMSAQAASRVDLHSLDVAQANHQYALASATVGAPGSVSMKHAELLGLDANSSLQTLAASHDSNGSVHYRYQQTFRGIPIFGEHVIVSQDKAGKVTNLFGRSVQGLAGELPATPAKIAKAQALSTAKTSALGHIGTKMITQREDARQMIYIDDANRAHMTYVVSFFADSVGGGHPTRPFVIVDANSGIVLKKWEGLETSAIGTGPGGNAKTGQYEWGSGGLYGYLDVAQSGSTCTMNNTNVKSVNLN